MTKQLGTTQLPTMVGGITTRGSSDDISANAPVVQVVVMVGVTVSVTVAVGGMVPGERITNTVLIGDDMSVRHSTVPFGKVRSRTVIGS